MGPWVLYKTRHIKDTHYWAMQTRLVILAGYVFLKIEHPFVC